VASSQRKKTAAYRKLEKTISNLDRKSVKVGWFSSAKYTNGTPIAYVAAIQEFGFSGKNIPPRPFMRPTAASKEAEWIETMRKGSEQVAKGKMTVEQVLGLVGQQAVGDIKEAIIALKSPALKAATIESRRRKMADGKKIGNLTKPLVETGRLLKTVQYEVD